MCGTKYNVLLINALVFYLGIRAVEGWAPTPGTPPGMQTPSMEAFQHLLRDMDTGGWVGGALLWGGAGRALGGQPLSLWLAGTLACCLLVGRSDALPLRGREIEEPVAAGHTCSESALLFPPTPALLPSHAPLQRGGTSC